MSFMVMVILGPSQVPRSHQSTSAGRFGLVRPEWIRYIRAVPQIGGVRLNTDVTRDLLCDLQRLVWSGNHWADCPV